MKTEVAKVLLVEDNPADIRLTQEAFKKFRIYNKLEVVRDGVEAMKYLYNPDNTIPDIILLDLNLPKKNGLEVLKEIKADDKLRKIPIIILTTSDHYNDINESYKNYASCYITKPVSMSDFIKAIEKFKIFWFSLVKLPN